MKKILQDALFVISAAAALTIAGAAGAGDTPEGINLWPGGAPIDADGNTEDAAVNLYPMLPENTAGAIPAVVICPGGGYGGLCIQPEGYDIARWLNDNGIAGFVLEYRLPAGRETVPLADAQRAIRFVRANAEKYGVDPNKIGIIGFSAGGHLASTAATHFDAGKADAADPIERVSCRPDFAILIYPVILFGDQSTYLGTQNNLLGKDQTQEKIDYFSNEKQVSPETPPVLLAHAVDDVVVPIENSRAFARAMQQYNLPYVLVELPDGNHGLNGYKGSSWDMWQALAVPWIHRLP
ncbi:MAG: alpha/beta hydrolase [Thermoguttaceae bacterium]|nr:alpha/beta hydrolase [Thermoguttaceae bacterium]